MTNKKTLYGETYITQTDAEEITDPIKLAYYKVFHMEDTLNEDTVSYGIEVVKEHTSHHIAMTETKEIPYKIANEEQADALLALLKDNKVTPIGLEDVLEDLEKHSR